MRKIFRPQVEKTHYNFHNYVNKKRWMSIYCQLCEVSSLSPGNVLEIGIGSGVFKVLIDYYGINIDTVDIDSNLHPDYIASANNLSFDKNAYDCVCAFQVLEHLEYKQALQAFSEMVRVSKKHIVLSLPDSKKSWSQSFYIPKFGEFTIYIPKPRLFPSVNKFDGEHYWEINKKGYSLKRIINDFSLYGVKMIRTYKVPENTYHRFFVFEK